MIQMFGSQFDSQFSYEGKANRMWKEAISRLTVYQIKWVIAHIAGAGLEFAPNLSVFNKIARQAPLKVTDEDKHNAERKKKISDAYHDKKHWARMIKFAERTENPELENYKQFHHEAKLKLHDAEKLPVLEILKGN